MISKSIWPQLLSKRKTLQSRSSHSSLMSENFEKFVKVPEIVELFLLIFFKSLPRCQELWDFFLTFFC